MSHGLETHEIIIFRSQFIQHFFSEFCKVASKYFFSSCVLFVQKGNENLDMYTLTDDFDIDNRIFTSYNLYFTKYYRVHYLLELYEKKSIFKTIAFDVTHILYFQNPSPINRYLQDPDTFLFTSG